MRIYTHIRRYTHNTELKFKGGITTKLTVTFEILTQRLQRVQCV